MSKYPDYKYIDVKVIAKSLNLKGEAVTTFEVDYPRYIHSEIMTHRVFGRNAQSSRAVPVAKTLEANTNWVRPILWGKNKAGMAHKEVLAGSDLATAENLWDLHAQNAFAVSQALSEVGLHKAWSNRITEPFSRIKVVITATEWDNFFWLRDDEESAQPEIVELAQRMKEEYESFAATQLDTGHWHLPYVNQGFDSKGKQYFTDEFDKILKVQDAVKISASCCGQVSYRKLDQSKAKAIDIYEKLFSGSKPHLSPCDHIAKVGPKWMDYRTPGVTHMDREGNAWSGNLKNFVQYRHLIDTSSGT